MTALLKSRPFPQQAYRSCLGVLSLARKYPHPILEAVCQQMQAAHLLSYRDVKAELENRAPVSVPAPLQHENIRGESYYIQGEKNE